MSMSGKEYKLAIRIAGVIDKTFTGSLNTATKELKGFKGAVRTLDSTFTKMDKYGDAAFRALTTAATVAATAVGAVTAAAVKVGSEFEAQMSTVQAISGASTEELGQLSDKARSLAEESVFSAREVGSAMEYMGLAGWKTHQMLEGIEGVLDLAAASGEDLATVSDIVTDDLTAFNMTADETQRMVDVMAQTAMNSNTTVGMMGEAFKYAGSVAGTMGYQIEDLGIAIGTIASQGIKSSMAGTALRNMITRMVKPTKESTEAMEALGLSVKNDKGEYKSFLEIMTDLREGMQKYDKDQRNYYAAELGGQRGMAAIAAIANATQEDFDKLTDAIYHAEGAADKMASVRLDNLKGDVTILKDVINDLGIEFYNQESGPLRSIVQTTTKILQKAKGNIPEIGRKISKFIKPIFEWIVDKGKWIVKNGDKIVSVLAGIAASIVAFKALSSVVHFVSALMALGPVGGVIMGIVAAIGLLVGALVKLKIQEREAIDDSLAEHFGDLSLSLTEVEEVARRLVEDESLRKIKQALEEYEELDSIGKSIDETAESLQKLNWKVDIGLGLNKDERKDYKRQIKDFVKESKEYLTQSQYAANLNLSTYFDPDSDTMAKVNKFFEDSRTDLTAQAKELKKAVNEAFSDNLLTPDEAQVISEYQEAMKDILNKLSESELNASTTLIKAKYGSMADLDSESFAAMQDELNEAMEQYSETQEESYKNAYAVLEASGASQSELDELAAKHLNNLSAKQAEISTLLTTTIADAYGLKDDLKSLDTYVGNMIPQEDIDAYVQGASMSWDALYASITEKAAASLENSSIDMKAVGQLLEQMEPQEEQLEALAQKYRDAGEGIPANILEGIQRYQELELMSGDTSDIWAYFGSVLVESDKYEELLKTMQTNGEAIPEELAQAIEDNLNKVDPAATQMYNQLNSALVKEFAKGVDISTDVRVNARLKNVPGVQDFIDHKATGGLITSPEVSWLAEKGPEMVVPLDKSKNAISLWEKAGQLLGMGNGLDQYNISEPQQVGGATIEYKPTLQFYGEAPSRSDLDDALRMSQEEFNSMMEKYLRNNKRLAFS